MNDDLDRKLAEALGRRDPPPWLEAKIAAAIDRGVEPAVESARPRDFGFGLRLRWLSVALATLLVCTGVVWQRERAALERAEGKRAAERLEVALKVTSQKLRKIQQIVNATSQE
jgi:hypothetical protein